jgi:hypothetical protein
MKATNRALCAEMISIRETVLIKCLLSGEALANLNGRNVVGSGLDMHIMFL